MVDSQIRPNKVTDPRILRGDARAAARTLPAGRSRSLAYFDEDVPLGNGRA